MLLAPLWMLVVSSALGASFHSSGSLNSPSDLLSRFTEAHVKLGPKPSFDTALDPHSFLVRLKRDAEKGTPLVHLKRDAEEETALVHLRRDAEEGTLLVHLKRDAENKMPLVHLKSDAEEGTALDHLKRDAEKEMLLVRTELDVYGETPLIEAARAEIKLQGLEIPVTNGRRPVKRDLNLIVQLIPIWFNTLFQLLTSKLYKLPAIFGR